MIDVNKPRIIAVDASKFYQLDREDFEHAFVKVLYAAGKRYDFMNFNSQSNNQINSFYQYDERLVKKFSQTEEEIEKNKDVLGYFYKDEYKDISAVILVWDSIFNKINNKHFEIFLNTNAVCSVDVSQLINKFDYWLASISSDNSKIRLECHRVKKI